MDRTPRAGRSGRMSQPDSTQFRLHVLGAPDLRAPDGRRVISVLSQPKRLGLLTYLALAPGPVSRGRLVALFWPESDEARARNALSQAVFYLRRSLHERGVESVEGDRLWAPPEHLWCDARERLAGNGVPSGTQTEGTSAELLEGWNADDSHALQEWLDAQRHRLASAAEAAPATPARAPMPSPSTAAGPARATPPPSTATPASSDALRRPRTRLIGGAALALLAAVLLGVALAGERGAPAGAPVPQSLAVLLPQISATDDAPRIDAAALHAEILAQLPRDEALRIISATYAASLQELLRQLEALGVEGREAPGWVLEVSVRLSRDGARAIGLLHRGPTFDLPGRVSFDVSYRATDSALLEAPQEIARGVSAMVAEVLGAR
jgi:hypothetical protein